MKITRQLQDTYGPRLFKKELREEMKSAKRLDNVDSNMELNPALCDRFHKVRI